MTVLSVISPLVLVAFIGFIAAKSQWMSKEQINTLSRFTFSLAIPAFLFFKMATAQFSDQINGSLFAAFYLPVLISYTIAYLFNHAILAGDQKHRAASAVFALGSSYSNTVIVGLPVLLMVFGEQVIAIIFLVISFHSAMLFGLTSALASASGGFNWQSFIRQTLSNPLILSISTGLAFNLLAIPIPEFLSETLVLMGKPAITLALFILGASLSYYKIRQTLGHTLAASLCKLVLLPALVYMCAAGIFMLQPVTVTVLVILSACSTGVNAYLIALQQQQHQETVASTVVVSTLVSVVTIPLWLWFLGAA